MNKCCTKINCRMVSYLCWFSFLLVLPVPEKEKSLNFEKNQGLILSCFLKGGATSNRKSICIALFLNKLYLYYDVSPLNKVFTTLHRSTQVCVLGSISACKGRYLFGIINISKNFFLYLLLRVCLNFVQHSFRSCFEDFSLYH